MLHVTVVTIFPELFPGPLAAGVVGNALGEQFSLEVLDLRSFADPPHRQVDDAPFGGGAGMVLKPEPVLRAVRQVRATRPAVRAILMSPQGERFTQQKAAELAGQEELLLVCGRYQGVDQRAREEIGEELSLGDFILSGGEIAAAAVIETVVRLLPGVVGNDASLVGETFGAVGFEPPLYTRPAVFEGRAVPEVLRNGNHRAIEEWRADQRQSVMKGARPAG